MELIDSHCHLTELSTEKLNLILDNAKNANVTKMICIGASSGIEPNFKALNLSLAHSNIFASIGIHPHDAGKHTWSKELEELATNSKVVAIGETGLDFNRNWSDFNEQESLFRETISIAKNLNLPLVIHCRDAHVKTLEILKQEKSDSLRGVFHCFGENIEIANSIIDLGFLISLTGIITFKKSEPLRLTIKKIPLDFLMLETDSPYMAPEPHRGKESESAHVKIIAETLARIHNVSLEEIATKTTSNAKKLFCI